MDWFLGFCFGYFTGSAVTVGLLYALYRIKN